MDSISPLGSNENLPLSLNSRQASGLIVSRARLLVKKLIELRGHDRPPFSPLDFAKFYGINEIKQEELGDLAGILLRFFDGPVIRLNQKDSPVRQNFSCAHEIAHLLYDELKLDRYVKTIEFRSYILGSDRAREKAKERLCDVAAAELLMPGIIFQNHLSDICLNINSIEYLANLFEVSIQASAIRIAEVSKEPCITLLWNLGKKPNTKKPSIAWRAGPGPNILSRNHYFPVHIECPSSVDSAYQTDNPTRCYKLFKLPKSEKRILMESKGFGHGERRFVISLAYVNR